MEPAAIIRSRAGTAYGTLSEEALRALLDKDRRTGNVVVSRGQKISRTHYARLLECTPSALTRFGVIFAEYEKELGIVTGPLRHLPQMRKWLKAAYEARQLEFRGGKLDRLAFTTHFELRGGTFITRHHALRELFEEFDARAEREGYLPSEKQEELERVRAVLAGKPQLNKDRMSINLVWVARMAQVSKARFRDELFAGLLAERQSELMMKVRSSRIDPYVYGRVFPFSDLASLWQTPFLERVGIRFKQIAAGLARPTVKGPYRQLLGLLHWIGTSANPHCRGVVAEAGETGRVLSLGDWEDALFAYRSHLLSGIATDSAVDSAISALRIMLDGLASGQVVPAVSMPLPGVKNARRRGSHLRSFAEAGVSTTNEIEHDYVTFARERLLQASQGIGLNMVGGESDEFINGIATELKQSHNLPTEPVAAIRQILERRLEALRNAATSVVKEAVEAQQRGRELLALAEIDGADFECKYLGDALSQYDRDQLVRGLFPHPKNATEHQVEQGVANLLSLIEEQHGGLPPRGGSSGGAYGQFFAKRYLAYGGLGAVAPMLNPMPETVGAVLTLYLIDSGANVGVGRTLDRRCMEASDIDGHRRITGYKARSKGKPIIVDLLDSSSAVWAIDWLLSTSSRLEANTKADADNLFLMRIGGRVQLMTSHWYTGWFKKFVASTPSLAGVELLPNMIRPSVLLQAALADDGRLATGMAIGQHGLAVTQGYQQKWPTRLLYDENIRRFHNAFETLVMSGVEDAALKLGITAEQFKARLGELRATGLGTFCRDQRGRPGETSGKCSTLDCWNECPHLLIVAEAEAIATLQLWQSSLRLEQPGWERDRPERWNEVWLPWLCLTDVVEEKMTRGPLIKTWKAARLRATEISTQPGYVPPRPW